MRIESVTLENYGAYRGLTKVQLADRGVVFVRGKNLDEPRMGSNGAGKSTIFDALDWALFGKVPRGDTADSVINDTVCKNCRVEVELMTDDGANYRVERTRKTAGKTSSLRLWKGDDEVSNMDAKATQAEVERVVGFDRSIFLAMIYRPQFETKSFANATDADRKAMLTRVFQLDALDVYAEKAKALMAQATAAANSHTHEASVLSRELEVLASEDLEALAAQWQARQQAELGRITAELQRVQESEAALIHEVNGLYAAEQHLAEVMRTPYVGVQPQIDQFESQVQSSRQTVVELKQRAATLADEARALGAEARRIQVTGETQCSQCYQRVTAEHAQREAERLAYRAKDLSEQSAGRLEDAAEVEKNLNGFVTHLEQLRAQHDRGRSEWDRELFEARAAKERAERAAQELGRLQGKVTALQASLTALEAEPNPVETRAEGQARRRTEAERALRECEGEARVAQAKANYYAFWVEGFGSKGLKSWILDHRLGELNEAVNHYVRLLTGGTIWVRFETQRLTQKKKLTEELSVRVFRHNPDGTVTARNLKSWSGGEYERICKSIDEGLASIVARRATGKCNLLILDEVFKHLDAEGRLAVVELIELLARERESVFVIDHDAQVIGSFDHCMTVIKENGQSTIASE